MIDIEKEIKDGIKIHLIKTNKFKTNLIGIFLTTKITRENVTKNAVLSSVLRRGSKNLITQEEISKELEEMYGSEFDCGIDKTGDNHVFKFYIETINDNFLPEENLNLTKKSITNILDIAFNPYLENEYLKKEYIDQEKINVKHKIEGKIDNKGRYALDRAIEEMYKDEPFGLYKFGYIEDLEEINEKNLYEYYLELLKTCKIDIFVSGLIENNVISDIENNENILKLEKRDPSYIKQDIENIKKDTNEDDRYNCNNILTESMDITQGKLVLGLNIKTNSIKEKFASIMYNSILGGSANSKMFQNVREKAHLAYVASSSYYRNKDNIFINSGIEIKNYEKALEIIIKQIVDMEKGDFSEFDIDNAKKGIIDSIKAVEDEQDSQITYFYSQELNEEKVFINEYIENIYEITKEDILNIAKTVNIDTIYFLKN